MTRSHRNLLFALLIVCALFAGASVILHSTYYHRTLLEIIQKKTGWNLSLSDSKIKLWRGLVILSSPKVNDPQGRLFLTADSLLVNFSPLSLLRGKFVFEDIQIQRPVLFPKQPASGVKPSTDQVFDLFSRLERSLFLQNLIVENLIVEDLTVHPPEEQAFTLLQAKIRMEPTLLREIEIQIQAKGAAGPMPSIRSLDAAIAIGRNTIKLKQFKFEGNEITLDLEGAWKGNSTRGSVEFKGNLEAPDILSDPLHFGAMASLQKNVATFQKIEARLGTGTLTGTGDFHLKNRRYNLLFSAKDLTLESLFQKMSGPILAPSKGIARVEGKASGQLPSLVAEADATIENFRHGPLTAREATGTLQFNWPQLDFTANVRLGDKTQVQAVVTGGVAFKHLPGKENLQGVCRQVDLRFDRATVENLLPTLRTSGLLDGTLHLEAAEGRTQVRGKGHAEVSKVQSPLGPIDLLTTDVSFLPGGKISFHNTSFVLPLTSFTWPNTIDLDTSGDSVRFRGQPAPGVSLEGEYEKAPSRFQIHSLKIRRDGGHLEGSLDTARGGQGSARLKGLLNLDWLRLLPAFFRESQGLMTIDLNATGSFKQPVFHGRIEFQNSTLGLRILPGDLSNLKGTLEIQGSTLRPRLTGSWNEGPFHLEGETTLDDWKLAGIELKFQGTNLSFSRPNTYRLDFDADVTLKGRMPSPTLSGNIDITDGLYTKKFVVQELVLKPFEQEGPVRPPSPWESSLEKMGLDLWVRNSGDLRIKNNVATIGLRSDLRVGGTYGRPRIQGALVTTEGQIHYFGQDFDLIEGRLEFLDPSRQEPYLLLSAEQSEETREEIQSGYQVFIEVKGALSNLNIALTSSPSLPRDDILSLMTVGMTQQQIRESGRAGRSVGAAILAGEISGVVEKPITRTTGLDIFRLEASESGRLSRFSVGKNLTERLSLEFRNDFAPETAERRIQANYYLTDNIILKGLQLQTAGSNSSKYQLNVSFRFRLL